MTQPSCQAKGGLDSDVDSLLQQLEASAIAAEHRKSFVRGFETPATVW